MKYLGKRSVASFLRIGLNVVWSLGIAMAVIVTGMMIYFIINNGPPHGVQPPKMSLDAGFIRVEFLNAVVKKPKLVFLAFFPFGAVMVGLGLAIVQQLRKIFGTLVAGNPFLVENAKRIRTIGVLIFAGVLAEFVAGNIIGRLVVENVTVPGVTFNIRGDLNLGGLFFGLIMLILAEIFRQGALLREEQDLTV